MGDPDAMVGELVGGRYRVLSELSTGGMGVVCKAVHEATGRHVALKVVRDSPALDESREEWIERFKREARVAGTIDTPHIAQVFDAAMDEASGLPFIAMELLAGSDLNHLLKRLGPLPVSVALKIVAHACVGLERAHAAGVVHRDIKPGNLFLAESEDGSVTVKLLDFGIAKLLSGPAIGKDGGALTQTGSVLGTPTYMSPEQARGLRTIDHRSDVWSLGVVLFQALSGTVPHQTDQGVGELIIAICTQTPEPIQARAPWVPDDVAAVVTRALTIDRAARFQSAQEMRLAIERLLPGGVTLDRAELRQLEPHEQTHKMPRAPSEEAATELSVVRLPMKSTTRSSVAIAVAATAAIGAAVWWATQQPALDRGGIAPPPAPAASNVRVQVTIDPADADVEVDGERRRLSGGRLELEGPLGASYLVKVKRGSLERSVRVAVARDGAVPPSIALSPPADTAPQAPPSARAPRTAKAPPSAASAEPKAGIGLRHEFE